MLYYIHIATLEVAIIASPSVGHLVWTAKSCGVRGQPLSLLCIIYRMDAVVAFGLVYWFGLMLYVWVCVGALYCRFVYFLSHVHFVQTNEKHVIVL